MRVELDPVVSRSSWFRIMPRYKVRAEGERVRMGDRVGFISRNFFQPFTNISMGQFQFHC